jgi:hypothetical protein
MKTIFFKNKDFGFRIIGFLVVTLPIVIYYFSIQIFTINIPFGDEYSGALQWTHAYIGLNSAWSKFLLLFRQANEHRIFSYHISVLTDYIIFGELNFKRLLWEGNLGMIALFFLATHLNRNEHTNPWFMLPIALLLFIPQHEISDWGIVAFGAIFQYAIILASLILLAKPGRFNFFASMLLAFIATFSFGNGMFVYLSGFLVLFLLKQKDKIVWLQWISAMIFSVSFYFTNYNFSFGSGFSFGFINNPIQTIQYFFIFFGSIFTPLLSGHIMILTLAGLVLVLFLGYLLIFKWNNVKEHPVALAMILFILLSSAAAAVSRLKFGIGGATAPRYILLQALFLSMLYIITINVFISEKRWLFPVILVASSMLFIARLYNNFQNMQLHKTHLREIILAYEVDYKQIKTFGPSPKIIKQLLDISRQTGIYVPPSIRELYPEIKLLDQCEKSEGPNNLAFNIDEYQDNKLFLKINGWAFLRTGNQNINQIGVVLKSETKSFVFSTIKVKRADVAQYFKATYPDLPNYTGFSFLLDKKSIGIPPGFYHIGFCILDHNKMISIKFSEKFIDMRKVSLLFN